MKFGTIARYLVMRFTVVMACHNNLHLTRQSVESLQAQEVEFVFVDNASTDGTGRYLAAVPNSTALTNPENVFVNPAWNQGLAVALERPADYVVVSNNDIVAQRGWERAAADGFAKHQDGFFIPSIYDVQGSDRKMDLWTWGGYFMVFSRRQVDEFYPLPECFKILHGDRFIDASLKRAGYRCYSLSGLKVRHLGQRTRHRSINDLCHKDNKNFMTFFNEHHELPRRELAYIRTNLTYFV
jgi:GT2 family glycosyltransferase